MKHSHQFLSYLDTSFVVSNHVEEAVNRMELVSLFSLCLFRVVLSMRYSDEMTTEGIFSTHQGPVAKAFRNSCPDFNLNFRQFKSPVFSLLVLNET